MEQLKCNLSKFLKKNNFKGTILLGNEGINGSVSCEKHKLKQFIHVSALGIEDAIDSEYAISKLEGEKLVRISDKDNDTFQMPARWPTPEYAINNIKLPKNTKKEKNGERFSTH